MAVSISGTMALTVAMQAVSALDIGSGTYPMSLTQSVSFTNGTGVGKANKMFSDIRAITSGSTDNVDLAGTLVDAFGNTLTFTKVKALIIIADPTNTVNITVGNGSNPAVGGPLGASGTNALVLQPGDCHAFFSNSANGLFAVTASTGDILKVLAGAANVNYTIIVIGE